MCQKDLTNCRGFLAKQCYSTVLFSGLPELKSTKGFLAAARDVVFKSPELIIVHNRNSGHAGDRLVDLVYWFSKVTRLILYHDLVLQTESTTQVPHMPLTSHLVQVWGSNTSHRRRGVLFLPRHAAYAAHKLPWLHAPLDEMLRVAEDFKRRSPHFPPLFGDRRELTLGSYLRRPCRNVIMMHSTTLPCMKKAIEWNPNLERLQGLTDLYLDGEWIVSAYIGGPRTPAYQRPIHPAMEQLTILTDLSVSALYIVPEEVRRLIGWMPRLKRLSTDSYDIRLCVQNYFPHVALTWTSCTTCAAEFPEDELCTARGSALFVAQVASVEYFFPVDIIWCTIFARGGS
ncbi:hypothetical protein MRX96_058415 [Rhipicephalus microplus]